MRYAVARYTPDLFRREPRNIGVFVCDDTRIVARLAGERWDGQLDLRNVPEIQIHGSIYAEWFAHWKRTADRLNGMGLFPSVFAKRAIATLLGDGGDMFSVRDGGLYVPQEDETSAEQVADLLYQKLVQSDAGEGPKADEAGEGGGRLNLFKRVRDTFAERGLLMPRRQPAQVQSHLIRVGADVNGTLRIPHRPRFSQLNGKLTVMEDVDFAAFGEDKVRDHALSTAYMLSDIHAANALAVPVQLIAIVHYSQDRNEYAQKVGKAALESVDGISLVNWDDPWSKERLIRELAAAAGLA